MQASLTPRRLPLFVLVVLVLVFLLSYAYEFYLEEAFLTWLGVEHPAESAREHWRYVISVTSFTAIALMVPGWALHRALTKRERMLVEIQRLASHDGLTGLPNRRLFMDRLEQAMRRANRDGRRAAVMFLDLDDFKPINDTLGHREGDAVLRLMADRLARCVRETDTVARFGGDEFVIVVTDVDDRKDVEALAQKVNEALSQPLPVDGGAAILHASIGVALYPDHAPDAETLLLKADEAMYEAKNRGKGGHHISGEDDAQEASGGAQEVPGPPR
jgi:diguanylate cyclase (GGDEF)-like protein